jgi:hypothetical protein
MNEEAAEQEVAVEELFAVAIYANDGRIAVPHAAFKAENIQGKVIAVDSDGTNVVFTLVDEEDASYNGTE